MKRIAAFALMLSGCATVERAPVPAQALATLPPAFAFYDRAQNNTGAIVDLLPNGDLAFTKLVQHALDSAPTLEVAIARIDIARARLGAARAEQLPNVAASGSIARERLNQQQFGGALPPGIVIPPNRTVYDARLDASWDADLFGRLRAARRAATARLDAASSDAAGVRLALQVDIARAVIDARALDARAIIAQRDLERAAELVALTRIRANAGVTPEFDLVRARSLEADAMTRLEPIETQRAGVIGQLVTLTGLPAQEVFALLKQAPAGSLSASPAITIPSVLLRARPDVNAAEFRLRAADEDIAAAAAERYPRFAITATLGLFSLGLGSLLDEASLLGSVGAALSGPLLDFGRVAAGINERQAVAREAFAEYRRAVFSALGETEAALGAVAAADRRADASERQAVIDADATMLTQERYRRGLDNFLTVIDAERTGFASRSNAIEARADTSRARIALYKAIGGASGESNTGSFQPGTSRLR